MKPIKSISLSFATLLAALAIASFSIRAAAFELNIGIQTWTLRNLNFDQMVEFAAKHHLKEVEITAMHLNPTGPMDEIKRKREILEKNGLHVYTFGVAGTSLDKEENRKLFEFAKFMGIKLIIVEPGDFKIFDNLEELVKEYDIKVAIHNHGLKSMYGNPLVVKNVLKHRDPRIGVCLDVGWATAATLDAAKVYREYEGRVFDIHLKDKRIEKKTQGEDTSIDTKIGEGQTNLKGLFAELKKSNYNGILAIETDGDYKDPTDFVASALKFVKENQP
ncbi:MAG: sugar phosphate isomerase/epimerase [Verrucomicrobia bacterium]|nr:sugar phosphate isomerase/epimerase [Verrucomicrobiota bacterium]